MKEKVKNPKTKKEKKNTIKTKEKKHNSIVKEEKKDTKKKETIKSKITKQKLFYILIAVIDIIFIIYCARRNYANYVKDEMGEYYYIGDSKDLLFGKNYITLIFSSFVYIYLLLSNIVFFGKRNGLKKIIILFFLVFLINITIFFIFTKRIY